LATKQKVLFLTRWYPDRFDPMLGLFIKRHAEVAAGFADVAVLYLRSVPDKPFGYMIDQKVENGVTTAIVYYGTKSVLPSFIAKALAGVLFLKAFCKGYAFLKQNWHTPDLIHVHILTRLGVIALWLRLFQGIRYVITEHWSRYLPVTGTYSGLHRKIATKMVVRYSDAVSTVSLNLVKAMQQHGLYNKHYMVLPNVVDTALFVNDSLGQKKAGKRMIHVSCFEDRSKNISGILRTLGKLKDLHTDFECFLVGEGADLEPMKAFAATLGLFEPHVCFTGLLENEKLIEVYKSADFMIMFSNYENMPVVISESLSLGMPVVATSVGGIPEYINNSNGLLVPAGDESAFLNALSYMLDHYDEFDTQQIRQEAVAHFSKQSVCEKLQTLYSFVAH